MDNQTAYYIYKGAMVLGLASISAWTYVKTEGERGEGWGVLAVIALLFV